MLIDCLDTSWSRAIEAAERLKVTGLEVSDAVVLSDNEGGAREWASTSPDPPLPESSPPKLRMTRNQDIIENLRRVTAQYRRY